MGMYAPHPLSNYATYYKFNESLPPAWNPYYAGTQEGDPESVKLLHC